MLSMLHLLGSVWHCTFTNTLASAKAGHASAYTSKDTSLHQIEDPDIIHSQGVLGNLGRM